jgi:Ribonucleotide reductase inhibitor
MAHQAKRPYNGSQPSITSYFGTQDPNAVIASSTTYSNIPSLPPNVQSNLLQVGMRIRKSVPEGYKTGSPFSGFSLFSNPVPVSALPPPSTQSMEQEKEKIKPKTRPRAGARELTPFCGLLKVGGMAQQQWGIYSPNHSGIVARERDGDPYAGEEAFADGEDGEMEESDEMLPPWSSQGSMSTVSSSGGSITPCRNKRSFVEDDEDGGFVYGGSIGMDKVLGERVLAVPRRKKWVGSGKLENYSGQENVGIVGDDVDFEEAEFLDYGLIKEVEMGGC